MKKFFTYTAMIILTMTLFTSCDIEFWEDMEDRSEARTLDGTWTGYIDTYYYDRWGLTGDSYRTTMYFERTSAYSGWGYEVDYDLNSRYSDYYRVGYLQGKHPHSLCRQLERRIYQRLPPEQQPLRRLYGRRHLKGYRVPPELRQSL